MAVAEDPSLENGGAGTSQGPIRIDPLDSLDPDPGNADGQMDHTKIRRSCENFSMGFAARPPMDLERLEMGKNP